MERFKNKKVWIFLGICFIIISRICNVLVTPRLIILLLFSLMYIVFYLMKVRTKANEEVKVKLKRLFLDIIFIFSIFAVDSTVKYFIPFNLPLQNAFSELILSIMAFFFVIRIALAVLPFGLKGLIFSVISLLFVGYFKSEWWTGISLLTTLFLFVYSDDLLVLMSEKEIDKKELPYDIKRGFVRRKLMLLTGNIAIYFSLIISNELKEKKL